ncbi:MAG TPA: 3-oxoadipate enol-lactonase [Terriglobales bacterium]|nr:3-oxoadipate enol-lactonase [Terriglobales bacterium]
MFLKVGSLSFHVQVDGPASAPVLLLLHSLGTNLHVWDWQVDFLANRFRVIRPDLRGHGKTGVPSGPYSIEQMADDVIALMDALEVETFHLSGLSIGGLVAQQIAHQCGTRVQSLVLCDTALSFPPAAGWRDRAALVRREGIAPIVDAVIARWVTASYLHAPATAMLRQMLEQTAPEGYAAACEALAAADLTAQTATLRLPSLVIVGSEDLATPPASAQALAAAIPGARLVEIPDAAHIPNAERPGAVGAAILGFVDGLGYEEAKQRNAQRG